MSEDRRNRKWVMEFWMIDIDRTECYLNTDSSHRSISCLQKWKTQYYTKFLLDYTCRARWPEGLLCLNNSTDCLKFENLNCAKFSKAELCTIRLLKSNPGCGFPTWNMYTKMSKSILLSNLSTSTDKQTQTRFTHHFPWPNLYLANTIALRATINVIQEILRSFPVIFGGDAFAFMHRG